MLKKIAIRLVLAVAALITVIMVPFSAQAADGAGPGTVFPVRYNTDPSTYVSLQTTVINGMFFTVDSYHDRIIYNDTGDAALPLLQWKIMADDLNKPHCICSDGVVYLVVDTDNNRVVTYTRLATGEFMELQSFENVGIRPHYCVYDAATSSFYVWSSYTGEMYIYKRSGGSFVLKRTAVRKIECLYGLYTRSFTIDGNNIIFCSQGAGGLVVVNKWSYRIVGIYPVADEIGGMVQISHVGRHYYLTTSTDRAGDHSMAMTARSDTLAGFANSATYTDVTAELGGLKGIQVPYYMTNVGGLYFVRFVGNQEGYADYATCFIEDAFGNIFLGSRIN